MVPDLFKNTWLVIPARKGSKGLPKKNQILLKYTLNTIPKIFYKKTIISTDDTKIVETVKNNYKEISIHLRSISSAIDTASTKDCLKEVIKDFSLQDTNIIMLYLTYPERSWQDIVSAYNFFNSNKSKSLLCKTSITDHPYLCMFETNKFKGKQIIKHDLYRRQDYPRCFKISHMITIFQSSHLQNLNSNLYNEDTDFYNIKTPIDVDTIDDLNKVGNEKN